MSSFSEFVKSFCVVAISGGLAMLISPEGQVKKYVKYIISLCMVCALLSPILSFAQKVPEYIEKMDFEAEKKVGAVSASISSEVALTAKGNIETEVENLLAAQFGYAAEEIYVVATIDYMDVSAVKITDIAVYLSNIEEQEEINTYLSELFLQTANIHIMKKGE